MQAKGVGPAKAVVVARNAAKNGAKSGEYLHFRG
jgi:hypothetical protein